MLSKPFQIWLVNKRGCGKWAHGTDASIMHYFCITHQNFMFLIVILFALTSQLKYIVKFSTDGAVLNNNRAAVQATVKIIDVDQCGKPLRESNLPAHLQKEICIYYFIGMPFVLFLPS